jgi:hypothetical protein
MSQFQLIDTFPEFLAYWQAAQVLSTAGQIESWGTNYMRLWPELMQKQLDSYAEDGMDWREAAGEHIFPHLAEYVPAMKIAHDNLLPVVEAAYRRSRRAIGFDNDLIWLIYVGIGCGAGWATSYAGTPAVLFGLENIAAEGWQDTETLMALTAHELGHLAHFHWRQQAGVSAQTGPWWQLYTEGVAQWCEERILGHPSWHMQAATGASWSAWCKDNIGWLAAEFLRRVDIDDDIRPFFGSWYNLQGYKQTGYFLGHTLITMLSDHMSLRQIALLDSLDTVLRPLLNEMKASG